MPQKRYILNHAECRAARKRLGWSQAELARRAQCAPRTIVNFETGRRATHINHLIAIRRELEDAGIKFSRPAEYGWSRSVRPSAGPVLTGRKDP
jgi:transcriptional regulator with XRE-family HTH domain